MKRFATESAVHTVIERGVRRVFHYEKGCEYLSSNNVKGNIIELDTESDAQIIGKMRGCKFCSPDNAKETGSGYFMTKGTIKTARDGGRTTYRMHKNKECYALHVRGSEIVELDNVMHNDLLTGPRVRKCMYCEGTAKARGTNKPSKPFTAKEHSLHVPKNIQFTKVGVTQPKQESGDYIDVIVNLAKEGRSRDYILGYVDALKTKKEK